MRMIAIDDIRRVKPSAISLVAAILFAAFVLPAQTAFTAESHVRPYWGSEALWGYWKFGGDYVPKRDWKIVAATQEGADVWKAQNLIDDDAMTFYASSGRDVYEITVDLEGI